MKKKLSVDELAIVLSNEIEKQINTKLGKIDNPVLRKAVEETLRDAVYSNLQDNLSGQIGDIIDKSLKDITALFSNASSKNTSRLKGSFKPVANDDSGSKDSGGKTSAAPVRKRASFGGKDNGFGGK